MLAKKSIDKCEAILIRLSGHHDVGHDLSHIRRVRLNSLMINKSEKSADPLLIELCAMFHDVGDHKFNVDPEKTFFEVSSFLRSERFGDDIIDQVLFVSRNISFSLGNKRESVTPPLAIVMDADRLDAIGAIGIARAFSYGGFRNRPLYSEGGTGSTIHHFHEKLLLLKDMMNTPTGMKMAQERHDFMIKYLQQFEFETGFSIFHLQ